MEASQGQNDSTSHQYINCKASEITKLLRNPVERKNLAKELSK